MLFSIFHRSLSLFLFYNQAVWGLCPVYILFYSESVPLLSAFVPDYLHFYGEDRLLGIGMEADEETGSTKGMKLSMFDISNPAEVQEISKLHLVNYNYSEALYNHRAVMISVNANIFGFELEGYESVNFKRDYLVFSYENDKFVQKLKLETSNKYGEIHSSRGTFIGEVFYLLTRDGSAASYDLNTGKKLESL